jgi:arylsulfatase A-like enzyme
MPVGPIPASLLWRALAGGMVVLAACGGNDTRLATEAGAYRSTELAFDRDADRGRETSSPGTAFDPPFPWNAAGGPGTVKARIELGGEQRWSWLCSAGNPLEARARVPGGRAAGRSARLALDLFVAREMPGAPEHPRVALSVSLGEALLAEREVPVGEPERWWTELLSFELPADWDGHAVRVRVEPRCDSLAPGSPGTFYLAVSSAVIDRPLQDPPTVVLVTSDTHRGDHLGAAAAGVPVATPALDALARRGVLFEDCFAPSHVTLPSHAALFTGTSPRDTAVINNATPLAGEAPTLAEAFRDAGWLTAAAVSLDILTHDRSGLGQGFELLSAPVNTRRGGATVDVGLHWLDAAAGRPLFLWLHVADAHAPYDPPGGASGYPEGRDAFDGPEADGEAPPWLPEVRDMEYVRALYRGEVTYLDGELGRLLDHPRARRGVVAVTADHGEVLGRHGIWWRHKDLYPDTLHVPLLLAWPGGPAGARVSEPVELVDLGRTLLDRAGLAGAPFPGRDLMQPAPAPRFAVATNWRSVSVQSGEWHLILHLLEPHRVELYRRSRDPWCETDLTLEEPERARALREELIAWLEAAGPGWAGEASSDPATLERLAELGYADQLEDAEAATPAPGAPGGSRAPPRDCPCEGCRRWR